MVTMKRGCLSILLGVLTVGLGIVMAQIGGWGPCGPASGLSVVGGWLTGTMLCYHLPLPPLFALGLAVVIWSSVFYLVLGVLVRQDPGA
jgi:hypothetical protein